MKNKMLSKKMVHSVSAKQNDWIQACMLAAKDDGYFRSFRSYSAFQRVVEGTPKSGGVWNLKRLLSDKLFVDLIPVIQSSDTIGLPLNMIDVHLPLSKSNVSKERAYSLSPTTIRYANNAINCMKLFGKDVFNGGTDIYEIGSGYGGECKIFNDFSTYLFKKTLGKNWHIFDLKSSEGIIKRFLSVFGYKAKFKALESIKIKSGSDSLAISNAAFSEMNGSLLDDYFDNVIAKCGMGYFITNFESQSAPYGGWKTDDFIERLKKAGKTDVLVLPTKDYLSLFDSQAGSKIIIFGYKSLPDQLTPSGREFLFGLSHYADEMFILLKRMLIGLPIKYF